jgi:hypothetical protein
LKKAQLARKDIEKKLAELGLSELVAKAIKGHIGSLHELKKMAKTNPQIEAALYLLQTVRNPNNQKRREWVSPLERAGRLSNGQVHIVQGGAPGIKKR